MRIVLRHRLAKSEPKKKVMVRFRHPATGHQHDGEVHTTGAKGATIVGEDGEQHQVDHGHYLHHESPAPDREKLKQRALADVAAGAKDRNAVLAAGVLLSMGGMEHVSKLTTSDVQVIAKGVQFPATKIRVVDPPELAKTLRALAKADGALLQVDGEAIQSDELLEYALHGPGKPLRKASPLAISLASPAGMMCVAEWMVRGYHCSWNKGPKVHVLIIRHPSLPLPFHEVIGSLTRAKGMARQYVASFERGEVPEKGIYAPM